MAKKNAKRSSGRSTTEPKFPYTTQPSVLRRLLHEIPKRPKPSTLSLATLKAWNLTSSNDASPIGVLKKIGLISTGGEPLQPYLDFMQAPPAGPRALGARIKEAYRQLFESSHEPHKNSNSELRTFFNIHSGGGERAIDYQIQTFKALSEHADFSATDSASMTSGAAGANVSRGAKPSDRSMPPVQIDLHIHLPENKTARDYEAIIQDIAKYIYGREVDRG